MKDKRTENAFETEIVKQMVESKNWIEGKAEKYDRQRCLYIQDLTDFVKLTQYEEWQKLTVAQAAILQHPLFKMFLLQSCNEEHWTCYVIHLIFLVVDFNRFILFLHLVEMKN